MKRDQDRGAGLGVAAGHEPGAVPPVHRFGLDHVASAAGRFAAPAGSMRSRAAASASSSVADEVLPAVLVELARALERFPRLRLDSGDEEADSLLREGPEEIVEHADSRGVDRRHVAHAKDEDLRGLRRHEVQHVLDLIGGAEEERPVDLVDFDALGDRPPCHALRVGDHRPVRRILQLARDRADVRHVGHALDEEERRQHDADLDGDGQVDQHGQQESRQQDRDVALRASSAASRRRATRSCGTRRRRGPRRESRAGSAAPTFRGRGGREGPSASASFRRRACGRRS